MFLSAESLQFFDGRCDISFRESHAWRTSEFDDDMRTLQFALGDASNGPLVMLAVMSVGPGDEEKFPPIIHMHRSDSFRTIVKGHFDVGRQNYCNGTARLQESGSYYGPEQPGAASIAQSDDIWSLLVFADKRGHRVHPADMKYRAALDASDEKMSPFYRQLGIDEVLPPESSGVANVISNPPLPLRAGFADIDFAKDGFWPLLGQTRVTISAIGGAPHGPLILALSAPPGAVAVPRLLWSADMFIAVTRGSATTGGQPLTKGNVRLLKAGTVFEELRAGPEGLESYLVLSDRGAPVSAEQESSRAWIEQLKSLIQPLLDDSAKAAARP